MYASASDAAIGLEIAQLHGWTSLEIRTISWSKDYPVYEVWGVLPPHLQTRDRDWRSRPPDYLDDLIICRSLLDEVIQSEGTWFLKGDGLRALDQPKFTVVINNLPRVDDFTEERAICRAYLEWKRNDKT